MSYVPPKVIVITTPVNLEDCNGIWNCSVSYRSSRLAVFYKKMFLKTILVKLQAEVYKFIKKDAVAQVVSCKFAKFLRTPSCVEHLRWLLFKLLFTGIKK